MKKSKLFRGLTGTYALLTALCSYAGILAFENSGQVEYQNLIPKVLIILQLKK